MGYSREVEWKIAASENDAHAYDVTADDESFPICGKKYPWYARKGYAEFPTQRKFAHCRKCYRIVNPPINWKERALAAEAKLAQLQSSEYTLTQRIGDS